MDRVFQKPYQPFHIMADCPRGSTSYGTGVEFESTSDAGNHFGTLQFFEVGVHPLFLLGSSETYHQCVGGESLYLGDDSVVLFFAELFAVGG